MTLENRREYVEREFEKWNNEFIIPFEQVFDVKAILDLEHQYLSTPDEHVKTKSDIVHTMQRLKAGLRLKPKNNTYIIGLDPCSSYGSEKISVRVETMNSNDGTLKARYIDGVDYSDLAHKLIGLIKEIKPTKIYIDKVGNGSTLLDVLKFDLKKHGIRLKDNGDVSYQGE